MTRPRPALSFLGTDFATAAAHFRDVFGFRGAFAAFFVALVDYDAVDEVRADGIASEEGGGEVDRAYFDGWGGDSGGEVEDGDFEAVREGNGGGWFWAGCGVEVSGGRGRVDARCLVGVFIVVVVIVGGG